MDDVVFKVIPDNLLEKCSRDELITLLKGEQQIRKQYEEDLETLKARENELKDRVIELEGKFVRIKNKIFGKSSEKTPKPKKSKEKEKNEKESKTRTSKPKLPSERYKNVEVIERDIDLESPPTCKCCESQMIDSGMTEVSEHLTVIPKRYLIIRQMRHKYRCGKCHGDIQTTPVPPRIKPKSTYSDEMILDIALSKYCDLIPIERYCAMADRQGIEGLPQNSLIEATHHLADFVTPAVEVVRQEQLSIRVMSADETTHNMLEGDEKSNWFLWGFSGPTGCYFEFHRTRSGDVASNILIESQCEILLTDVYSGYSKAVRIANEHRESKGLPKIKNAYCNAHSRRYFKDSEKDFEDEVEFYLKKYRIIYKLENEAKSADPLKIMENRLKMTPVFEEMLDRAQKDLESVSAKSGFARALKYFIKNYEGLTLFLKDHMIRIDNNAQERALRNPVIGRKTWYGTHSVRGAETAAKLFTLVESCKINKVNPREYFPDLVQALHKNEPPFSPHQYKLSKLQ